MNDLVAFVVFALVCIILWEALVLRSELRQIRASLDALDEMLDKVIDTWRVKP